MNNDAQTNRTEGRSFKVLFLSPNDKKDFQKRVKDLNKTSEKRVIGIERDNGYYIVSEVLGHEGVFEDLLESVRKMTKEKLSGNGVKMQRVILLEE